MSCRRRSSGPRLIHFDKLPEFQKELKRLTKKYRSLPEDLQEFTTWPGRVVFNLIL